MLTNNQAVRLLAFCAAYDQRTVGEFDIKAWQMASGPGRWDYDAAQRVIVEHYAADATRPRVTPAMVTDRIRQIRGRAAESFELPRIPDGLPDGDYPGWLRSQLAAHCDAALTRWATTGAEPAPALPAASAAVADLEQLVARAPIQHRRVIGSGVRELRARRVRLDPVRRDEAHRELDEARAAAEGAS